MTMKLYITNNCINCGACNQIYNEVFDMTKHGAVPNNEKILNEEKCYDAIFFCPVVAIHIQ